MLELDRLIVIAERPRDARPIAASVVPADDPDQLAPAIWLTRAFLFGVALLGLAFYGVERGWWG